MGRQNLTISLDRQTLRKVKIAAALALLDRGFHLGGNWKTERAALHER